jgi:hypothetical protein
MVQVSARQTQRSRPLHDQQVAAAAACRAAASAQLSCASVAAAGVMNAAESWSKTTRSLAPSANAWPTPSPVRSAQCALRRHERRALEDLKPHAQHPRGRGPSVRGSIGEIARQLGELRRPPAEVAWRAELGECSAHGLLESRPVLRAAAALVDVDAGVTQERASAGHELSRFAGKHVIGE